MKNVRDILQPIQSDFNRFQQAFEQVFESDLPMLNEVLDYVHAKRGKQLRPQLVLLSAQMCRGVTDKTIRTAIALELLHTASLIHDDVVDSSPIRRGSESVQEKWSNKVAILVGDYMLAEVVSVINSIRNLRILNIVADMGAALSSGELIQLHLGQAMWITEEQYMQIIRHKTAQLFAACMEAGAESSGATMRQSTALREFGMLLGICFQMKDDIFDFSDSDEIGKPTMNDIRDGKVTLPLIVSLQRAPKEEAEHIRQVAETLAQKAVETDISEAEQEIKSFVMRYDGVGYVYRQMQTYRRQAEAVLSVFRSSPSKESLLDLLNYAINRSI